METIHRRFTGAMTCTIMIGHVRQHQRNHVSDACCEISADSRKGFRLCRRGETVKENHDPQDIGWLKAAVLLPNESGKTEKHGHAGLRIRQKHPFSSETMEEI